MQLSRDISGQNFIVTGAARGIGLAISTLFCNLGAKVSGWDIHAGEMRNNSVFADTQFVDVTSEQATLAGFASSLQRLGDIDGIIANAGINGPTKPMWEYSLAEWHSVMEVDLTGVFLSIKASLEHFRIRKRGRIIIISSIAGKEGNPGAVPYGAAKAGVIGLAKGLSRELLPSEITVNCIAPSIAVTELLDGMSNAYIADKKSRIPKGRFCTPEEIAHMAAFIASPACSFTTGQVFDLSGGRATW
ncbi:MAG: 3-oxoacyl-ACP reductase [Deltaproteobacteria bacterium]|nr:3-oxoacyl-ACP reductase [Deltaproteobacteria bacterium]